MLSDGTIRRMLESGWLGIEPSPGPEMIQPASVDVRLDEDYMYVDQHDVSYLDPALGTKNVTSLVRKTEFLLHPGRFVLASTIESVRIPSDVICQVNGKSSLGRLGLMVHATAGFVDPGFQGNITLELSNVANVPILLRFGMKVAQLTFMYLDKPCERPYGSAGLGSKYQNQSGVEAARGTR